MLPATMQMLKLCSNGVHLRTLISLHLNRQVLLYSTSSPIEAPIYTPIVNYLVKSLGFSRDEAITIASKKVSSSNLKSSINPDLVVDFLKLRGFNNTQIKKIVSSYPDLLWYNVSGTLDPKLNALQELGIKGSDLTHLITRFPTIFRRGLSTRIVPFITYLNSILGSTSDLLAVLRRSYRLISVDVADRIQPNIELLRNIGLSNESIRKLLVYNAEIFSRNLEKIIPAVDEELGIPRNSFKFANGIIFLASSSAKTRQMKYQLFKSLGWTESDISTIVRKLPKCLLLSETLLRQRLIYFMSELGYGPEYIASHPYILIYSTEARVVPRINFLRILKERNLIKKIPSILTAISISEPQFLERFVLPYKVELPELCEAYIHRKIA